MATIVNKSEFTVSVNPVGVPSFIIGPGKSDSRLSDKHTREWADRPHNKFISAGLVLVRYDKNKSKPAAKPPATAPAETPAATELGGLHWQRALAAVAGLTDLDVLEQVHATETRPRVKSAIEERMKELQGGDAARNAG